MSDDCVELYACPQRSGEQDELECLQPLGEQLRNRISMNHGCHTDRHQLGDKRRCHCDRDPAESGGMDEYRAG